MKIKTLQLFRDGSCVEAIYHIIHTEYFSVGAAPMLRLKVHTDKFGIERVHEEVIHLDKYDQHLFVEEG